MHDDQLRLDQVVDMERLKRQKNKLEHADGLNQVIAENSSYIMQSMILPFVFLVIIVFFIASIMGYFWYGCALISLLFLLWAGLKFRSLRNQTKRHAGEMKSENKNSRGKK